MKQIVHLAGIFDILIILVTWTLHLKMNLYVLYGLTSIENRTLRQLSWIKNLRKIFLSMITTTELYDQTDIYTYLYKLK